MVTNTRIDNLTDIRCAVEDMADGFRLFTSVVTEYLLTTPRDKGDAEFISRKELHKLIDSLTDPCVTIAIVEYNEGKHKRYYCDASEWQPIEGGEG